MSKSDCPSPSRAAQGVKLDDERTTRERIHDILTESQLAAELTVLPRTLRLWRRTRGLPHIKLTSKVIRYRRADINTWLERNRVVMG
jgi:hypothetical protein